MKTLIFCLILVLFIVIAGCGESENSNDENGAKIDLLNEEWPGWALAYSGYRKGQNPQAKIYPSQGQIEYDLKIIEKNWKIIRIYGADQHSDDILQVIKRENINLKVMLGIWLDGEPEYNEDNIEQVKIGIDLANKYSDIVIAINVGNESQVHWSDHKVPGDKLISYIKMVKSEVKVPVTTADSWDYWLDLDSSSAIIEAVDFLAVHIYPIWGKLDIDQGLSSTIETYQKLSTAIPNKKIVITEAGWATYTEGELHVPRAGDEKKQQRYFNELMQWSKENKVIVFWFEAFDEPWKGKGTEGYWGLFTEGRNAKLAMHEYYLELVSNEPTSPTYD